METPNPNEANDEPNAKRVKMEESSTSSKPESEDPFLSLPSDIIAKIISKLPIAQWPSLESADTNFQSATWIAWRQLRCLNLERELFIKHENSSTWDRSSFRRSVECLFRKLVERAPFLSSLNGIVSIHLAADAWQLDSDDDWESNSEAMRLLAQFEHLQSISVGDAKCIKDEGGRVHLENVVEFLESTRSRTTLKELQFVNITQRQGVRGDTTLDRFASSLANGREIQSPLKLEKFVFMSFGCFLWIRLDTMDATRLTDLRVGKTHVEPNQLASLIERASNLHGIEFSFMYCDEPCAGTHLDGNKKLLMAVASHENLAAIKFDRLSWCHHDITCTNLRPELIAALQMIGRRGKLRRLALEDYFVHRENIDWDEICATIRNYIPHLQSIKLLNGGSAHLEQESLCNIVSMTELEEIDFMSWSDPMTTNAIEKIAQLPRLKRLAFNEFVDEDPNSLARLSALTSLMDLRIGTANCITAGIFEKWSNGFASNLQILMLGGPITQQHDEEGLVRLLEKAVRLRVLVLRHRLVTDRSLMAVANTCTHLEILELSTYWYTVERLQEIVDRCPKLKRLGIPNEVRQQLHVQKYRKISDVDTKFARRYKYNFDDHEYE